MSDVLLTGIQEFRERWGQHGPSVVTPRLSGALRRQFLLRTKEQEEVVLTLTETDATLEKLSDVEPHAIIEMDSKDWSEVLQGKWSIMSIVLAGRCTFLKHERRYIMQLSMLMQTVLLLEAKQ